MYNKILAPVDGSKLSECSLAHIKEIATGCHVSEVVLLLVLEQQPPLFLQYGGRSQIQKDIQEKEKERTQAKETAEKYLLAASQNLKAQGVTVQNILIEAEENQSVAEVILHYSENNNMDLIVMSTHGRSGVTRWAFGSVADRVVRHSKTPVLTVAPAGCRE